MPSGSVVALLLLPLRAAVAGVGLAAGALIIECGGWCWARGGKLLRALAHEENE